MRFIFRNNAKISFPIKGVMNIAEGFTGDFIDIDDKQAIEFLTNKIYFGRKLFDVQNIPNKSTAKQTVIQNDGDIEAIRDKYKQKFDKEVPRNKKNDLEWLQNQIND